MKDQILSAESWPRPLQGRRVIEHVSHPQVDISTIQLIESWIEPAKIPSLEALADSYKSTFINARVGEILVANQNRIPSTWNRLEIAFLGTQFRSAAKTYEPVRYVNYMMQTTTGFWEICSAQLEAVLTAVACGKTQVRLAMLPRTIH